ncbi:MAG TPA: hypothetical protein ENL20_11170 [Candidatus Cloacimonetes bacterium]|nr:hypothetical protein [Candidatus Cloacimonadota bacterium]
MKKIIIVLCFLLMLPFYIFSIVEETASFSDFLFHQTGSCEYDNWISHVSEGIAREDWNTYAPYDVQTSGFGDFLLPENEDLSNWEIVIESFLEGNYENAQTLLDTFGIPYQVVQFSDLDTGQIYYLLREDLNLTYYDDNETPEHDDDELGSFDYGWGLYVYNPAATQPVIISAPHPNDDFITPVIAYKCFRDWDAMFFLVNGAGREVKWTEQGDYTNSKSLSDPSRNEDHPFQVAYKMFCDQIREDFGRREFSAQIHSYDWDRHEGHANCQVSAGSGQRCPNLPIRDLSDLKIDLINYSQHLMIPANTIGDNETVFLNDYYAVYYSIYDFIFSDWMNSYEVNNDVDLPGYGSNNQMEYTLSGWNSYDVFEPFFHLEMDELPNSYEITEEKYKWFYAYDSLSATYDMEHLFDKAQQYYSYWIDVMTLVLPEVFELDDELIPATPTNFAIEEQFFDAIELSWEHISSFDFETYEVLYGTEPIGGGNYEIFSRADDELLASQREEGISIADLELNQVYYFKIRAKDYNDNYSDLSEEISGITGPAIISNLLAIGEDASSILMWTADIQVDNQGFNVYRKTGPEPYVQIDGWETNPDLTGSTLPDVDYEFIDEDLENGTYYYYKISAVNIQDDEFIFPEQTSCSPHAVFWLITSNLNAAIKDSAGFSANFFASDNYDPYYDLIKIDSTSSDYIFSAFYEEDWEFRDCYLYQETHRFFNPEYYYKTWQYRVRTDQLNDSIQIYVSDNFLDRNEYLYLEDLQTEEYTNLITSTHLFSTSTEDYVDFVLYWGDWQPALDIPQNIVISIENDIHISWNSVPDAAFYRVYSSDNPSEHFEIDLSGTFFDTNWYAPILEGKRFYFVTAVNENRNNLRKKFVRSK